MLKDKMVIKTTETTVERIKRVLGFDVFKYNYCKQGELMRVEIIPRVRSPGFVQQKVKKGIKQ